MLTIVSILALLFPLIWAISIGIVKEYIQTVVQHILNSFDRLKNEIVIFISAGYFGLSLAHTEVGNVVSSFIYDMSCFNDIQYYKRHTMECGQTKSSFRSPINFYHAFCPLHIIITTFNLEIVS